MEEEKKLSKTYDIRLLKRLGKYLVKYKKFLIVSTLLVLISMGIEISLPYLTKLAIDNYIIVKDIEGVKRIALIFISLLILSTFVSYGYIYAVAYAGQSAMRDLRMEVFSRLQKLPISFFDKNPVGRLVTRTANDVNRLTDFFTEVVVGFFRDGFLLIGIIVMMLRLSPRLAFISFIVIPPLALAVSIFRIKIRKAFRKLRVALAKINAYLNENITGMKETQLFNREDLNYKEFRDINFTHYRANMDQVVVFGVFMAIVPLLAAAGTAIILFYGGYGVIGNVMSLGVMVAFLSYIGMFFRPINELAQKFDIMQGAMAACERIFLLLDEKSEMPRFIGVAEKPSTVNRQPLTANHIHRDIEFRNVWFKYNKEWVLKDVSFKVEKGETVAIIGPTGAGKTSLASLLLRFYEPQKGTIFADGVDIRNIDKLSLRSNIGFVMQNTFLFGGSVEDNIRLWNPEISKEKVKEISLQVNIDKFIKRLPQGYETDVKERGIAVSEGEKQLISFARALIFNPSIIVLDEATSSIDTDTEILIQDATKRLVAGRTSIVIAHRLSTIKDVRRIIVLHKGEIVEQGTHSELLDKKGLYYALYRLQYR